MIQLTNKHTSNFLLVLTHPECEFCRAYYKSNWCKDIPLTKKAVLLPNSDSQFELYKLQMVYKADESADFFRAIMEGKEYSNIDWKKDISDHWRENMNWIKTIKEKYPNIDYTPALFIVSPDNEIIKEIVVEVDYAKLVYEEVREFCENH
jgi:hypothetical protein